MVPGVKLLIIPVRIIVLHTADHNLLGQKFNNLKKCRLSGEMGTFVHGYLICCKTNLSIKGKVFTTLPHFFVIFPRTLIIGNWKLEIGHWNCNLRVIQTLLPHWLTQAPGVRRNTKAAAHPRRVRRAQFQACQQIFRRVVIRPGPGISEAT
jgi:hypothetical protein